MAEITMPQLGETVTEGTITRWAKQVGDRVDLDEVLFEVSTDKVDSEVPSAAAGYVSEILVPEGETVDVGTRLAVISDGPAGDGSSAGGAADQAAAPTPAPAEAAATPAPPAPAPSSATTAPEAGEPASSEQTEQPAPVEAAGQAGSSAPPKTAAQPPSPVGDGSGQRGERNGSEQDGGGAGRVLSPVVRRLIAENHLDPAAITGSGAGGRITRDDVLALIDNKRSTPAPAGDAPPAPATTAPPPAPPAAPAPPGATAPAPATSAPGRRPTAPVVQRSGAAEDVIPFSKIRRITAEHMVRSKATSAHTAVVAEVDYEGVERVRRGAREAFKATEGTSLTYLPFIARAVIDALDEYPHLNSSVGDDELIVHRYINLGIAVDLDLEGLLVPVIHDADDKRLRPIAREIADLAGRARSKRLTVDDLSGGTFTLTNAGPFGTFLTIPVINQPQVAILSTDGVKKRPVAVELPDGSDGITVHPVGLLALSFDHRAVDGAYAAAFLARVKEIIETRDWSVEL
jgi:pyruvate dehydrogenase E2 component (dihydrolipoamide acetyltransferase)